MKVVKKRSVLITGGAGFIGTNAALEFVKRGDEVTILDNYSRQGTRENEKILRACGSFKFIEMDIRDQEGMTSLIHSEQYDVILHLAAQVAVTTSLIDPIDDFTINLQGTLFILEAIRKYSQHTHLLFASTNKVYGSLTNIDLIEKKKRYDFLNGAIGINESRPLDFHSPYGCSKGAADSYLLDYANVYGLKTTVFRQSCVYGLNQMGVEDQGWVAWFMIAGILDLPITVYGDGKQVRDLLYIDDLVDLYIKAIENPEGSIGEAFNVGGGAENSQSILEILDFLDSQYGVQMKYSFSAPRSGDQLIYISDNQKAFEKLNWKATTSYKQGVSKLMNWLVERDVFFRKLHSARIQKIQSQARAS